MQLLLAVASGSALGGVARYLLSGAVQARAGTFPVGTLVVNVLGSFVLGALVRYAALHPDLSPQARLLLGAGFCGGFTTFSTFSVELLELLQGGAWARAGVYASLSVALGLAAATAGMAVVRTFAEG